MKKIIHAPHLTKLGPKPIPKRRGLGDVVRAIAQPIAKGIDAATSILPSNLQTNVRGCGGCKSRQQQLNEAVPDVLNPFKRDNPTATQ